MSDTPIDRCTSRRQDHGTAFIEILASVVTRYRFALLRTCRQSNCARPHGPVGNSRGTSFDTLPVRSVGGHADRPCSFDRGSTFIELLVSIVLIGLVVTATLTALNVSIRGSDQHKSKVSAMAELEGAAAHLNRVFANDPAADCSGPPPAATVFNTELNAAVTSPGPLDDPNRGVDVTATNVTCANGVALVTLVASHVKGNASETLDVTVGGITVLEDGDMGAGPGPGPCNWSDIGIDERNPKRVGGGRLQSTVTVTLNYTGDCTGASVNLFVTNSPPYPAPSAIPMTLNGSTTTGEFEFTFAKNYFTPWYVGPVNLSLTTSTPQTFTDSFTVLP